MGMRIATNITALRGHQVLGATKRSMDKAMSRLASGERISKASDDAVGLALSENFKSQMRGLKQANRNAQDGISMLQISEGGLNEVTNMLMRLRELGIQAASDTVGNNERSLIDIEYQQLLSEIDRIAASTSYNGTPLLSGVGDSIDFQINLKNSNDIDRISYDASQADASTFALGIEECQVGTKLESKKSLGNVDAALNRVGTLRANLGAMQSRLNATIESLEENVENMAAANSRIRDADLAQESSEFAKQNLLMQSGTAMLSQANQQNQLALTLLQKS
jgi:flagellin